MFQCYLGCPSLPSFIWNTTQESHLLRYFSAQTKWTHKRCLCRFHMCTCLMNTWICSDKWSYLTDVFLCRQIALLCYFPQKIVSERHVRNGTKVKGATRTAESFDSKKDMMPRLISGLDKGKNTPRSPSWIFASRIFVDSCQGHHQGFKVKKSSFNLGPGDQIPLGQNILVAAFLRLM